MLRLIKGWLLKMVWKIKNKFIIILIFFDVFEVGVYFLINLIVVIVFGNVSVLLLVIMYWFWFVDVWGSGGEGRNYDF